jgi:hypothetical protein
MNTIEKLRTAFQKEPLLGWCAVGLLLLGGLLLVVGSMKSGPTVTGIVKVGGEPLVKGSIEFVPVDDKGEIAGGRGLSSGATIQEGIYRIDKDLRVGRYRVEIQGIRKTPRKVPHPLSQEVRIFEEVAVVPAKYNRDSILFREVSAGSNKIDFLDLEAIREKPAKAGK